MITASISEPTYNWGLGHRGTFSYPKKAHVASAIPCRTEQPRAKDQRFNQRGASRLFGDVRFYLEKKLTFCDLESEWSKAREQLAKRGTALTGEACAHESSRWHLSLLDFARQLHSFTPLITEIGAVWAERQKNDWDGYNASPINQSSREDAVGFVRHLPPELIKPEVVPESDGTLALEWQNNDSVFVVSFQGSGKLVYAGDFGNGRRTRGYENLVKGIPETIIAILGSEFASD